MTTYTNVFGGTVVYPAEVSYRAVSLTADTELSWPTELATDTNVASKIMNVTATAGPWDLIMPAANEASVGETVLIFNVGSNAFVVTDNGGNTIVSIAPGLAYQLYLTSNTTVNGVWSQVQYGAGTSSATAGSLAGLGIKAIGTTLNQSMSVSTISVNYSFVVATDRSGAFVWTGGAGTLTLPLASNAGNDWFVHIRNNGTGAITLTPSGSDLINGSPTLIFNPDDSAIVACSGTGWYSIGFGQAAEFTFDYDSIDLSAETTPYTLSGGNLNRIAYSFGGAIASSFDIIVPTTIQQYWVTNNTTGGYSITVKTAAGSGITIANGESAILYCNGTNVVDADTAGVAYPISVANGGTGATNATDARTNLSAAKSGVNGDITQIAGLSDGGASGPAVTFLSESNTGLYRSAAGALSFSILGTLEATLSASGLNLASGNAYSINGSSVLNATTLGSGVTASSLTSVGTLTSGALGSGFTTVAVGQGGTGLSTLTANGVLYGNGTSALGVTAAGTTGQVLVGNTGGAPSWATLSGIGVTSFSAGTTGLTPSVATTGAITLAGTLGVANGGTGATSLTSGYLVKGNGTSAVSASVVYDDGTNVGIGTSSPGAKLEVNGSVRFVNSSAAGPDLLFGNVGGSTSINNVANARTYIGAYETIFTNYDNSAEWMRIDASGNLLVGNTSQILFTNKELNVNAASGSAGFALATAGTARLYMTGTSTEGNITTKGAIPLLFGTNETERMRITSAGDVLVGKTAASVGTDGVQLLAGGYSGFSAAGTTALFLNRNTNDGTILEFGRNGVSAATMGLTSSALTFGTAGSERMRIDSSGSVGIGTTSPGAKLDVVNSGVSQIQIKNTSGTTRNTQLMFADNSAVRWRIGMDIATNNNTNIFQLYNDTTAAAAMSVDTSGNVGIGTSSPADKLDVTTSARISGATALFSLWNAGSVDRYGYLYGTSSGLQLSCESGGGSNIQFLTAGSERMRISAAGNVGIGTSSPDSRLYVQHAGVAELRIGFNGNSENYYDANTQIFRNIAGTEAMRITSAGNVGIGTSSPAERLSVWGSGTTSTIADFTNGVNANFQIKSASALITVGSSATAPLAFQTNATERMRIDTSGNVGIGTNNPSYKLDVVGSGTVVRIGSTSALNAYAAWQYNGSILGYVGNGAGVAGGASATDFAIGSTGARSLVFGTNDTVRAVIDASGNLLVGNTTGTSKITATGVVESTTGGFKFPDATTQTTKGIAAALTQITSVTASGTAVTFSNIPQTYTEIYIEVTDVSHNGGTSQTLRVQVSTDGVTYTTALNMGPSIAAAASVAGIVSAIDYSRNYVEVSTGVISSANASPYAGFMDSPLLMKITGGIKYVSFIWGGGASFDAGTITLYGR